MPMTVPDRGERQGAMQELAARTLHTMARGELSDFEKIIHPDAVNREAVRFEPAASRGRGPAALFATSRWLRTAFSELAFTLDSVSVQDDVVITHGAMSGRHTGDFVVHRRNGRVVVALAPTGRSFRVTHVHFLRVEDGLVREHWAVRDDIAQAEQLGWTRPSAVYLARCGRSTLRRLLRRRRG